MRVKGERLPFGHQSFCRGKSFGSGIADETEVTRGLPVRNKCMDCLTRWTAGWQSRRGHGYAHEREGGATGAFATPVAGFHGLLRAAGDRGLWKLREAHGECPRAGRSQRSCGGGSAGLRGRRRRPKGFEALDRRAGRDELQQPAYTAGPRRRRSRSAVVPPVHRAVTRGTARTEPSESEQAETKAHRREPEERMRSEGRSSS